MKKYLILLMVLSTVITLPSCNFFVEDYDVSPNAPTEVTLPLLLTVSEVATMNIYTGQLARASTIFTQQMEGTDFQLNDVANYVIREGDNDNEWESIYTDILINAQTLINDAGDENPYYRGIARVIKAMGLGVATDCWGDIPNSEALRGLEGEAFWDPNFDAQESVIQDIQATLDAAITDLSQPVEANSALPGADDVIHNGAVAQWTKAAYMLKARYANRLSKRDASGSADAALSALNSAGLTGIGDDTNATFGDAGNELNQWYAFQQSRGGYIQMGATLVDFMIATDDPRLPFYATTDDAGGYSGAPPGSIDQTVSDIGTYFASPAAPSPLVTYTEAMFIKAEAHMRKGEQGSAQDAYEAAIRASLDTYGIDAATADAYMASDVVGTASMETIMTHKWIALFTQVESWSDWRRTGFPTLTPNASGVVSDIPRRYPTALSERTNNPNALDKTDILEPVWWDE